MTDTLREKALTELAARGEQLRARVVALPEDSPNMDLIADLAEWADALFTLTEAEKDAALDEIDRLREAMTEIAENSRVPLEKSPNESLDVTAAKRLYEAWAKSIAIASQALRSPSQ